MATNSSSGKLDLIMFNDSLAKSGKTLTDYYNQLSKLGIKGQETFLNLSQSIMAAETPLIRTNKLMSDLWITMKNTVRWQITASALQGFIGSLETAYGYAQDLNESLTNIRIVTENSSEDMAKFAKQANKAAKALSTTTVDYTDAALIYYQQGLTEQEVLDRTETTIKMANAAGVSAQTASDQLTAVWNNFYDGSKSLEYYADVMVRLGADTASSSDEISEGIQQFAAVADTVGLSYEYAASALATVTATTRESANTVGTAFRTIFARIQGLNLGETLDDGTTLNKYSKALEKVGIDIFDTNGQIKEMDTLLEELGTKWETLSNDQQIALAQTVAGVRQYTRLIALMDNWDFFQENLASAYGAEGSLQEQADIYAESWEAARDRVRASAEDIYDSLINSDFYITVDNILTPILTVTADIIDGLGGMSGVLVTTALLMNKAFGDKIAQGMRDIAANLGIIGKREKDRAQDLRNQAAAMADIIAKSTLEDTIQGKMVGTQAEIVRLQGESAAAATQLSERQAGLLQQDLDRVKTLQTQVNLIGQQVTKSDSLIASYTNSLSDHLGPNSNWRNKLLEGLVKEDEKNFSLYGDVEEGILYNDQLKSNQDALQALISKLKDASINLSKFQEVQRLVGSGTDQISQSTIDLVRNLNLFEGAQDATNQEIIEYLSIQGQFSADTRTAAQDVTALTRIIGSLGDGSIRFKNDLSGLVAAFKNNEISSQAFEQGLARLKQEMDQITQGLKNNRYASLDWAETLVKVGTSLSQITMGITSINSIFSTFSDSIKDGEFTLEDFNIILTNLGMLLPAISTLFKENALQNSLTAISYLTVGASAKTAAIGITGVGTAISTALPLIGLITLGVTLLVNIVSAFVVTEEEAREKISDVTQAYEDQKSALESLNSELQTTKDRIEELNNQDTLTVVEQEELTKLEQAEASLQRQVELQEKLAQEAQKAQAQTIKENYEKSTGSLANGPDLTQWRSWNEYNGNKDWYKELEQSMDLENDPNAQAILDQNKYTYRDEYVDADTWFNSITQGLDKTSDAYRDYEVQYQDWLEQNKQITAQWVTENSEAIQQAEDDYAAYIQAIVDGTIEYDSATIANMQEQLAEIRKNLYGSQGEYEQAILEPMLDNQVIKQTSTQLYSVLSNSDIDAAAGLISQSIQNELMLAGISVDEFLTFINNRVDDTKEKVENKFNDFDFDSLTNEDWEILMDVNIDNFDTVEELQAFLDDYKANEINVKVNGIEELKELLDTLNERQEALETALQSYKDQEGYLTMDQVQELIAADESYAQYIIKVGDAYKLTNSSLQALLDSEREEEQVLDATIESIKEKYGVNTDYLQNYISMWDALVNKASETDALNNYTFTSEQDIELFKERTEALSDNAKAYQDGTISAAEYFNTINERISGINAGFHRLNEEIDDNIEETDLYEATLVAATGSIADGLIDLNKQFKSGSINMDDYYEGTIAATQALITSQSKLNKNIRQNSDGTWELKEGVDQTTLSTEEYQRAIDDITNLNTWEKQVSDAQNMMGLVNTLVDNYDYLLTYADDFGSIDFTVDNNFDTTSAQFQQMVSSMGAELTTLEQTNNEAYKRILQGVLDQGIVLADGLNTSASDLMQAMSTDANIAGAVINSTMAESGNTIHSVSQAAGQVLSALGELINNFEYTLEFQPYIKPGKFDLAEWFETEGKSGIALPSLGFNITGHGGTAVDNFTNALKEAGNYLENTQTGFGQGGIFDFGQEPITSDPNGALDPNRIATDNIRDDSGSGGDNEGTKYDEEDEKTLKDIEDRYHEITREIENQNDLLDDIGNNIDRAYGVNKLQAYQKELQELEKQQANYNKLLNEAETYLTKDQADLQGLFNNSLIFDENGEIEGYQSVLQSIIDDYNNNFLADYNAFLVAFSNLTKDEQEARQAEYDSWQLQKEAADELFQARQDALAQYEETLDKIQEVKDEQEELERSIADNRLSQIEYKLEVVIEIKDAKDAVRELTKKIAESFGDELTHGIEVARIDENSVNENIKIIKDYEETLKSYQEELANATDATNIDGIISKISDLQDKIISTAEALLDWVEGLEEMLPDALDAASERFAEFTDQLDHNESILGLIKELYTLQGVTYKTEEGFEQLQKVSEETMKAQIANAQLNKQWYDGIKQELLEAQSALDALDGDETDPAYDGLKANRDALLEEYNEAQQAMLSSAQAAMETAQEMYTQAIERAVYEFGQAVSGGVGLDLLQDKFDHYIEQEDRYLDKVNEAYEVSSWYNKLQQDIDKATNSKMKDQLKQLQEEIDIRRENNTLSEYDLEILEAKYNVLQAQMALEDAQNAKNQLRLVRDSQGNWNYQYTADASQIVDAEQNLLDAENKWYNIAKQQVEDVTGEIISTWQECQDKIKEIYSDMTLTDEERSARAQEIYSYYTQKVKDLENEKQTAIQDMTEAGNKALIDMAIVAGDKVSDLTGITSQEIQDIIANSGSSIIDLLLSDNEQIQDIVGSNTKLIDLFDNVFAKDLANMTSNAGNFEDFLSKAMDEASKAMEDYQTTVSGVADQTGTSLDDLKDYIDDVSTSTDLCSDAGSKAVTQMLEQISTIQDLSQEYLDMAESVREYIRALEEAARAAGNTIESAGGIDKDDLPPANSDQSSDNNSSNSNSGSSSGGAGSGNGIPEVGDEVIYTGGTYYYDSYGTDPAGRRGPGKKVKITNIAKGRPYPIHVQSNNSAYGWLKESQISGFDTGGYTGEFDNAKLAFLHEKELVLNQEDTKNILAAVSAIRAFEPSFIASIEKALDGNALSISNLMASRLGSNTQITPADNTVEPYINIERVEFPNATSSDEIQDAIRSLADDATQWANRRKG